MSEHSPNRSDNRPTIMNGQIPKTLLLRASYASVIAFSVLGVVLLLNCVFIATQMTNASKHVSDMAGIGTMIVGTEAVIGVLIIFILALADRSFIRPLYMHAVRYWQEVATRDTMTGLANRLAFMQALEDALEDSHDTHVRCGVVFVDLNRFKQINDTYGHAAGDQVITVAARRIRKSVGSSDMVARLGGDEFAVLLTKMNEIVASEIITAIDSAIRIPMQFNGTTLQVSASIGVRLSAEHHRRAEDLLHEADIAMYRAKAAQRWKSTLNARAGASRVRAVRHSGRT